MIHQYFPDSKSILALNGKLPEANFFSGKKVIVAADGAVNKLIAMNVKPKFVIGDLDSILAELISESEIEIINKPDQNSCDFEKALLFMESKKLLPTIVCGVNGGFLDHILNNIEIIVKNECYFYSPPLIGYVFSGKKEFNFPVNTKISVFGAPKANLSSIGLKWELENYQLNFFIKNSTFNRTSQENFIIDVKSGKVFVLIYLDFVQDLGSL